MSLEIIAENYSKEEFYSANGFSRQYIYKKKKSKCKNDSLQCPIILRVTNFRKKRKKIGSRPMFYRLNITSVGISKFEKIVSENNLCVKVRRKRIITTQGVYEEHDMNLTNGLFLNYINQVIAGDITYLQTKNQTYYIFTLKDMYSKRILGLEGPDNMLAESAVKALNQAVRVRGKSINLCIHHTDSGSQYKSALYKKKLAKHGLSPSYARNCLENGMAEQLNGLIKNDYLPSDIKDLNELKRHLKIIKKELNEETYVKEIGYKTPVQFENEIKNIPLNQRKQIQLYDFREKGV